MSSPRTPVSPGYIKIMKELASKKLVNIDDQRRDKDVKGTFSHLQIGLEEDGSTYGVHESIGGYSTINEIINIVIGQDDEVYNRLGTIIKRTVESNDDFYPLVYTMVWQPNRDTSHKIELFRIYPRNSTEGKGIFLNLKEKQ
jgi:hypothetical protein